MTAGPHELVDDLRDERDRALNIIESRISFYLLRDKRPETEKPRRRP